MKKLFSILLAAIFAVPVFSGTIIYKGTNNEKKFISEIDIVAIDRNIITFKIGKTTRTMPFSRMLKYYENDINMNLAYEDNSSDYDISIYNIKTPTNLKGITESRGKKAGKKVNSISFNYSLNLKTKKNQNRNIKEPYFYLYVLTASNNGENRSMYTFHSPNNAKIKKSRTYNEALMFEQAISSTRHVINPNNRMHGTGVSLANNTITIPLTGVGNRDIIAMHLVVWGKDEIIHSESKILNTRYRVSKNWHLLSRNN